MEQYYVTTEGWISGSHYAEDAPVWMTPAQAESYLLNGQLSKEKPVKAVKAAKAAKAD